MSLSPETKAEIARVEALTEDQISISDVRYLLSIIKDLEKETEENSDCDQFMGMLSLGQGLVPKTQNNA